MTAHRSATSLWRRLAGDERLAFLALALVILGPMLAPGDILTLDSPISLNWDLSGYFWNTSDGPASVFAATYSSAPIAALLGLLGTVLPLWLVQKLWLAAVLWLCAYGAFRLPGLAGGGRYAAAIFYTVNPFTYYRFVAGQWGVLGAYALIPWIVTAFFHLIEAPSPRRAIKLALLLTAEAVVQVHGMFIAALVLALLAAAVGVMDRRRLHAALPALGMAGGLFAALNLFWLTRYAFAGDPAAARIDVSELSYFAASPPLQSLALHGFWLSTPYIDPREYLPLGTLFFAPLLFLSVYGLLVSWDRPAYRWLVVGLVASGGSAAFLAIGPGLDALRPLFAALWENIPLYRVFRDAHKFIGLLALLYAYGFGIAVGVIASRLRDRYRLLPGAFAFGAAAFAMAYAFPMIGAWGQLQPTRYPADWEQARAILDDDRTDYNVLALPWHMYMDFAWLPNRWKRLVNPAPFAFSQPTISGDNLEVGPVESNSSNPVSKYVGAVLKTADARADFGRLLVPLNVRYIVLYKDADYHRYEFLDRQQDIERVFDGPTIAVYRNKRPTARAYVARAIQPVDDVPTFLRLPAADPSAAFYPFPADDPGVRTLPLGSSEQSPVSVERRAPVEYVVSHSAGALVFTLPQGTRRDGWAYEERPSAKNLGMQPTFIVGDGQGSVSRPSFYRLDLPAYGLSILILGLIVWLWRRSPYPQSTRVGEGRDKG